jgi:hypothetical protein
MNWASPATEILIGIGFLLKLCTHSTVIASKSLVGFYPTPQLVEIKVASEKRFAEKAESRLLQETYTKRSKGCGILPSLNRSDLLPLKSKSACLNRANHRRVFTGSQWQISAIETDGRIHSTGLFSKVFDKAVEMTSLKARFVPTHCGRNLHAE